MRRLVEVFAVLLLGFSLAGGAWADRGHGGGHGGRHGFDRGGARGFGHDGGHWRGYRRDHYRGGFGVLVDPFWYPWYDPSPYYYPPVVVPPQAPPVYIERGSGEYWYYCPDSGKYYPYVDACPGGWQPVAPLPPGP